MIKKEIIIILMMALFSVLCGCGTEQIMDGGGMLRSYKQISQDEAKQMMVQDDGHIIVDVRRQDEYDAGHIPGAVLIPNESIDTEMPEELPDLDQVILIYCRSGRRSKEAAQKLFDIGYSNVYEFGGIIDWTGEIVTEQTDESDTSIDAEESGTTAADINEAASESGYKIGNISYWPPAGSLVILYKQNGEIFEQQPIGHTDDDISFFDGMPDTDILFEKADADRQATVGYQPDVWKNWN